MPKKIARDVCMITYRNFPLRAYDSNDNEIYYYPKIYSKYWLKIQNKNLKISVKLLSSEIFNLIKSLNIDTLIFFGDYDRSWISKFTENRNDYKQLTDAVLYFKKFKIGSRFKGGIIVKIDELSEFIFHFYILTRCDASFLSYHFMNEEQSIIGFIHYSGELQILTLNDSIDNKFRLKVSESKFIDTFRSDSHRLT